MHPSTRSTTSVVALATVLALMAARTSAAAPWLVGNTNDSGPGSLREALANAADGDTIGFEISGTIALTSGQLMVTNNVVIDATNESVTVDGQQASRVFLIAPGKTVAMSGLTIANGSSISQGGGIWNQGSLTLTGCTLRDNWATLGGGGVYAKGSRAEPVVLSITDCIFRGNAAGTDNGSDGGGAVALVAVDHDSSGPRADWLTIKNSVLTNNSASFGGAIAIRVNGGIGYMGWDEAYAGTTVMNSTLSDNRAAAPDMDSCGGAIAVTVSGDSIPSSWADLTLVNCTLSGNVATNGNGIACGGAVYGSVNDSCGLIVGITNSTLSGNAAIAPNGYGNGGAVATINLGGIDGIVTLSHCTLSGNKDTAGTSGVLNDGGTLDLANNILANDPSGTNLVNGWIMGGGTVTSYGHNLSTDDGSGFLTAEGDMINTDPMLAPLQDNGGPTWTCALLTGSPAVDAGLVTGNLPATDQRGYPRIVHGTADIGAFESGFEGCFLTNVLSSANGMALEWTAFPMWQSTVMYSTNLVSMPFTILTNGMAYPANSYTDTVHAAAGYFFYRVSITPQ